MGARLCVSRATVKKQRRIGVTTPITTRGGTRIIGSSNGSTTLSITRRTSRQGSRRWLLVLVEIAGDSDKLVKELKKAGGSRRRGWSRRVGLCVFVAVSRSWRARLSILIMRTTARATSGFLIRRVTARPVLGRLRARLMRIAPARVFLGAAGRFECDAEALV
jgi:hypothetical protein